MLIPSWLTRSKGGGHNSAKHRQRPAFRPRVESLENRDLLATTLAIADVTVYETDFAGVMARFTVTLSEPSDAAVSVNFATSNGSAKSRGDYIAAVGTLAFAPGETSKTVDVAIVGDNKIEGTEKFFVNLSGAVNALIGDSQGTCFIIDDDEHRGGGNHDCDGGHSCG
jgi:hypothetical protein